MNADPSSTSGRVRACQSDPGKRARGKKTVPVSGRARANLYWPAQVSCRGTGKERGREKEKEVGEGEREREREVGRESDI